MRKAVLLAAETVIGELVPQYLIAIHLPDDFDPSSVDKAMKRDIDVLNEEIIAAGVGVFVGGLRPASEAKSLRVRST